MAYGLKIHVGEKAGLPPGQAVFSVMGITLSVPPSSIRFTIEREEDEKPYLSSKGWQAELEFLEPEYVDADQNRIHLTIASKIVKHLDAGEKIKFGLSLDGTSLAITASLYWPMQDGSLARNPPPKSSQQSPETPIDDDVEKAPSAHPKAARAAKKPTAQAAMNDAGEGRVDEEMATVRTPRKLPKPNLPKPLVLGLIAVVGVIISGFAGYFGYQEYFAEFTREDARKLINRKPGSEELFGKAERLLARGNADIAFLLYKTAAAQGLAKAATAVGRSYDPVLAGTIATPFKTPNPSKAAEWYVKGLKGGDNEAVSRIRQLMSWLRKRAGQGNRDAKKLLRAMRKDAKIE